MQNILSVLFPQVNFETILKLWRTTLGIEIHQLPLSYLLFQHAPCFSYFSSHHISILETFMFGIIQFELMLFDKALTFYRIQFLLLFVIPRCLLIPCFSVLWKCIFSAECQMKTKTFPSQILKKRNNHVMYIFLMRFQYNIQQYLENKHGIMICINVWVTCIVHFLLL